MKSIFIFCYIDVELSIVQENCLLFNIPKFYKFAFSCVLLTYHKNCFSKGMRGFESWDDKKHRQISISACLEYYGFVADEREKLIIWFMKFMYLINEIPKNSSIAACLFEVLCCISTDK